MEHQTDQSPPRQLPRVSFTQTFESSEPQKEPKYTLDKTLARGITQNNSSLIIEQQPLTTAFDAITPFDFEEQTKRTLFELRSRYDKQKTSVNGLQSKIDKMNEEKTYLVEQQKKLILQKNKIKEDFHSTQKQYQRLNYIVDQMIMQFDGYDSQKDRLKQDNLYYKKNIFDCTIELRKCKNNLRILNENSQREQKLSLRCQNLLQSVERTLHGNKGQRQKAVTVLNSEISKKREYIIKQRQRARQLSISMEQAQMMKSPQQKQFVKVLHTNLFVKKLLHSKMESLMNKYEDVNLAFIKIRQNTGIKTTEEMVYNFLHKDEIYGKLLQSISILQPKIETLKNQQNTINQETNLLQHRKEQLDESLKHLQMKNVENLIGEVNSLQQRLQKIDYFRNQLTVWASIYIGMLKGIKRSDVKMKYEYLKDLACDCLQMISKNLQEDKVWNQQSVSQQTLEKQVSKGQSPKELLSRNIRIKTVGGEMVQDQDAQYDVRTQKDYLHASRRAVKKYYFGLSKTATKC